MINEEIEIYNRILSCKPENWLDDSFKPVFEDYCSWVHRQNIICGLIREACKQGFPKNDAGFNRFEKLVNLSGEISRLIGRLATDLRFTQQAKYTTQAAATAHKNNLHSQKPWELS